MQEKDICSIEYFEDEERFADIVNGHVFHGERYVLPEDIQERKRSSFLKWKRSGSREMRTLYRDIVRLVKMKMKVVLIAMENQSKIHYAMPVRVMTEDSGSYYEQWKKIARYHRKKKDLTGAEFLSGIAKEEKLMPVITIVVYFGKEPWDGPRSLKEMLDLNGLPKEISEMVADYPLYLLEVRRIKNPELFRSDFRWVIEFLQKENSKQEIREYLSQNEEIFSDLDEEAFDLITVMSDSGELRKRKKECKTESGGVNMCQAIKEMVEDGKNIGIELGRSVGIELGRSEGIELGRSEGIELGRSEGIKLGRTEGEELAIEIMKLKLQGLSAQEIAKKSGASQKKVDEILRKLAA